MMSKFLGKGNDFDNECLQAHNDKRREHGVDPLILNKDLCKVSQKWAEELAKKDELSYSLNEKYGESVYWGRSTEGNIKITGRECVEKWYSEIDDYKSFGKEPQVLKAGYFTQIVWKSTEELGVGSAKSKSGKLYVVANYSPPGNIAGKFVENVLPRGAFSFFRSNGSSTVFESVPEPKPPQGKAPGRPKSTIGGLVDKVKNISLSGPEGFEKECLDRHNEYRRKHGVPALTIDKDLCKYSEEWAKVLVNKGKMEHRNQSEYGENIFYSWSSDPNHKVSGNEPVDKWYSEIKDHKFDREPTSLISGHFTQVVWADSEKLGIGMVRSKEGHVYVVANYSPPGNMVGSFIDKVRPPKF